MILAVGHDGQHMRCRTAKLGVLAGELDDVSMNAPRMALVGTAGVVAVLAVVLVVLRWDDANKVAVVVSALAAVAAVGVAIWAALPAVRPGGGIRVSRTGRATAGPGGRANTGVAGPAGSLPGDVQVDRTGDADGSDGGDANTGVRLD
jgi:hypothetical protein